VRLAVALGTCAFVVLGVVFCADRGGGGGNINTNLVHNTIRSSGQKNLDGYDYCTKHSEITDQRPADMKRGMCDTSGIYDHVLPFLHYQQVIPGKIYYGLDFTDSSYKGMTYTAHYPPGSGVGNGNGGAPCNWGDGRSVGRCIRNGDNSQPKDVHCPSTQRHIVNAWQQCAELCNDQPECHTFTVKTQALLGHRDFHCYFHKSYECKKENKKSVGIDNYVHRGTWASDAKYDNLGVWGGICRTLSGRTNDYACSNTPIPHPTPTPDCQLCGDHKSHCCELLPASKSYTWNFHCPGCDSSF